MRGTWRRWETRDGQDFWFARVESAPGQWSDLSQEAYEEAGYQPSFWQLPLESDYIESALNTDGFALAGERFFKEAEQPALVVLIVLGAAGVAILLGAFVVIALFG